MLCIETSAQKTQNHRRTDSPSLPLFTGFIELYSCLATLL